MNENHHQITSRTDAVTDGNLNTIRVRFKTGTMKGRFVIFRRWYVRGLTDREIARKAFNMIVNGEV